MLPWIHLASAVVPGDGGVLRLMQRGQEFSIMAGSTELMNSRLSGSEEALATLAWAAVGGDSISDGARVLIGGMGMGFTLRAQLAVSDPRTRITVAELVPEVLDWARGPMAGLHGASLVDPRVSFHLGDIGPLIRTEAADPGPGGGWDAILLDVDNGPEGLTRKENDRIYSAAGLAAAHKALRPGGVLAVWSSAPHAAFSRRLAQAGLAVEERTVRARAGRSGAKHVIWLACRRA